jgi:hypothetical protein
MGVYTTINDPSAFFQIATYTGNGGANTITNDGNANLQADWLWFKERSSSSSHHIFDTSRGVGGSGKALYTNNTDAESADTALTSVNTDGFTLANTGGFNENGQTNVCWQWKCNGGTTSSNSSGSITSTVQVNTTSGFSIVLYTGNETEDATVGHGFSSAPDIVITKRRSGGTGYWIVSSNDLDAQGTTGGSPDSPRNLYLNDTAAAQSDRIIRQINATTVNLQSAASANSNGDNYVLYCFKEVQGYSKFGHYEGNGNADGPFVYTGFKPSWLLVKASAGTTQNWQLWDVKRNSSTPVPEIGNPRVRTLSPSVNNSETGDYDVDFYATGFKIRDTDGAWNGDGNTYFYMAFAESPFVSSTGVPTTAK